ncbi:MAG: hypothetical protein JW991_02980 [Candidatus Pacebacteria bacterium]|nr:hypothetical protein [Candidatus Paceibacterota bacterium]
MGQRVFYLLFSLGMLFDIFFLKITSAWLVLALILVWLRILTRFQPKGELFLVMGLFFLFLSVSFSFLKSGIIAEKLAVWAYLFLLCGGGKIFYDQIRIEAR